MPFPGQVPGIGDNGPYGSPGGEWGADPGFFGGMLDPTQGGTLTVELPPGTYPTPGGGTVTQPGPSSPEPPFNPSEPWPGSGSYEPAVGAPIYDPSPGAGGEGYPEPYQPSSPEPHGTIQEGEIVAPQAAGGPASEPSGPGWSVLERIAGGVIGRIVGRVAGGPWGEVIRDIIVPTDLPPEPDMRGVAGIYGQAAPRAPNPVMQSPAAPAPVLAPRPVRPALPPVPRAPTVSVPKPDVGVQPWKFDPPIAPLPLPPSATAPPSPSTPATTAPAPATSSQRAPQSPGQPTSSSASSPLWQFGPSLPFPRFAGRTVTSSPLGAPLAPTLPRPIAGSVAASSPTAGAFPATGSAAPPLTPFNAAGVSSPMPEGESCETPKQQRQRRQKQRENCDRFVTITIPKHRRRVCAAEAAHHLGKHLGKELGRAITDKLGITKPKREPKTAKAAKLRVSRRGSVSYGGYGVALPKQMRPQRIPGVPKL